MDVGDLVALEGPDHRAEREPVFARLCESAGVATIHHTTLTPSKLDLLARWLPRQPWYHGAGSPAPAKAGGFRLDDPDGEVGIEVMIIADADGHRYLVPMSYRGAPLEGADDALLGTSEHGVLGRRWIYDAVHDPVAVGQLLAFAAGQVEARHQDVSDAVDASVRPALPLPGPLAPAQPLSVVDAATGTSVALQPEDLSLHVVRVLSDEAPDGDLVGAVEADVPGIGRRAVLLVLRR
jgi:Maltokinase N-terminal cap domain